MQELIKSLQLQPELIDYLGYLLRNYTDFQHGSGCWEAVVETQTAEENKEFLDKLIALGLVREVEYSYDADYTGIQEHERMIIGYQLTKVGEAVCKIGGGKK